MILNRDKLLTKLRIASVGAALPPRMVVLEQSDCFIFHEGELLCFNDEVMTRQPSPLDFDTVVPAGDFLKILSKLPDKEVDVHLKGGELVVKGKKRSAGMITQAEVKLPYQGVPKAKVWCDLTEGVTGLLKQAARTCGKDLSNPLTTVVHATPDRVEATDNFRLFRATGKTGIPSEILIPAFALQAVEAVPLRKVSIRKGWLHFRTVGKATISIRCITDDYHDLTDALKVEDMERVTLPGNLADMIDRAEIMREGADPLVEIYIGNNKLTILARKESGWYRETRKIKYAARALRFHVNPKFLVDVLQRTSQVRIGKEKLKIQTEGIQFVVALEAAE